MSGFELEINGVTYKFGMDRKTLVRFSVDVSENGVLAGEEIKQDKNELEKVIEKKTKDMTTEQKAELVLRQQDKMFYYALLKYQPKMTEQEANELHDQLFNELTSDDFNAVENAVQELYSNFTQEGKPKKAITIRRF